MSDDHVADGIRDPPTEALGTSATDIRVSPECYRRALEAYADVVADGASVPFDQFLLNYTGGGETRILVEFDERGHHAPASELSDELDERRAVVGLDEEDLPPVIAIPVPPGEQTSSDASGREGRPR